MNVSDMPMMECGHRANAIGTPAGESDPRPSCVICSCLKTAENPPNLVGRMARCDYVNCGSERPSTDDLAFFEYKGEGSEQSRLMCANCAFRIDAHWPRWKATISLDRNWYKKGRIVDTTSREYYAPDRAEAEGRFAQRELTFFTSQTHDPNSRVYGGEIVSVEKVPTTIKGVCKKFVPHGAYDFDKFYCGCRGWD